MAQRSSTIPPRLVRCILIASSLVFSRRILGLVGDSAAFELRCWNKCRHLSGRSGEPRQQTAAEKRRGTTGAMGPWGAHTGAKAGSGSTQACCRNGVADGQPRPFPQLFTGRRRVPKVVRGGLVGSRPAAAEGSGRAEERRQRPGQRPEAKCGAAASSVEAQDGNTQAGSVAPPRLSALPHVQFTMDWREVNIRDLEELMAKVEGSRWSDGSPPADTSEAVLTQFGILPSDATTSSSDQERRLRLAKVLSNGMVTVAAYVRASTLPGFEEDMERFEAVCRGKADSDEDWSWVAEVRKRRRKKVLVGFARASGDATLVSSMYDVLVDPELQGLGLGRKMLRRLCTTVYGMGIADVAVMVPPHLTRFFEACSFGPDQVCNSQLMAFTEIGDREVDPASHVKMDTLGRLLSAKLVR